MHLETSLTVFLREEEESSGVSAKLCLCQLVHPDALWPLQLSTALWFTFGPTQGYESVTGHGAEAVTNPGLALQNAAAV